MLLLLEPPPSPFDLKWQMLGIRVRVHPFFWLLSALLGLGMLSEGIVYLLLWVACVFLSILIHELGHVLMGMLFGTHGHILLYGFGGLAIGSSNLPQRWQRIAVYLAGPAAQFLLVLMLAIPYAGYSLATAEGESVAFLSVLFYFLFTINIFWPVLNLMPIWPLDGGQVSREVFESLQPHSGLRLSLLVSLVFAVVLAVLGVFVSLYTVLLFGSLAFSSWQLLAQLPSSRPS